MAERLEDDDPAVRARAGLAFGDAARAHAQPSNATAVASLLRVFRHAILEGDEKTTEKVRRALEAIGPIGSPAIVGGLDNPAPFVRWSLVRLLARIELVDARCDRRGRRHSRPNGRDRHRRRRQVRQ
jgi:HEAT repeat protein